MLITKLGLSAREGSGLFCAVIPVFESSQNVQFQHWQNDEVSFFIVFMQHYCQQSRQ